MFDNALSSQLSQTMPSTQYDRWSGLDSELLAWQASVLALIHRGTNNLNEILNWLLTNRTITDGFYNLPTDPFYICCEVIYRLREQWLSINLHGNVAYLGFRGDNIAEMAGCVGWNDVVSVADRWEDRLAKANQLFYHWHIQEERLTYSRNTQKISVKKLTINIFKMLFYLSEIEKVLK